MCVFALLWLWVIFRARAIPRASKMTFLLATTIFSATCITVRNFYRAIELSKGWSGYLITHEPYFDVLDGALMVLSILIFNFAHPVWCLQAPLESDLVSEVVTEKKAGRCRGSLSMES